MLRLMALDSIFCPVKALGRYLDVHVSRGGPLFQFEHGTFVTRADVTKLTKTCFVGNISLNTHSFRIGGASAAAVGGVPYYIIQYLGRWKSEAFKKYISLSDKFLGFTYASSITVTR